MRLRSPQKPLPSPRGPVPLPSQIANKGSMCSAEILALHGQFERMARSKDESQTVGTAAWQAGANLRGWQRPSEPAQLRRPKGEGVGVWAGAGVCWWWYRCQGRHSLESICPQRVVMASACRSFWLIYLFFFSCSCACFLSFHGAEMS